MVLTQLVSYACNSHYYELFSLCRFLIGNAARVCYENGTWADPEVLACISLDILRVLVEVCIQSLLQCYNYTILLRCTQAEALLPDANAEIGVVTEELIQASEVISKQLVEATTVEDEDKPLLPLDLNSTNNVMAQVRVFHPQRGIR